MKAIEYCSLLDKQISQFAYFREDLTKRLCMLLALLSDLRIGFLKLEIEMRGISKQMNQQSIIFTGSVFNTLDM